MKPIALIFIILLTCAACQFLVSGSGAVTPTLVDPTQTPLPFATAPPTRSVRDVATAVLPAAGTPAATLLATATITPTRIPARLTVGQSVQARDIIARRFNSGGKLLLVVGGIHGGWEANTVTLVEEMIAHFEHNPGDLQPGVTLMLIPVLNPDGLAQGRDFQQRFNANGVDLNRNWGCEWSPEAVWRDQPVNPGTSAFSEPETRALAEFIRTVQPAAVLFYHSAADGVFAGSCRADHGSLALAKIYGEASNYSYGVDFDAYPVSGTAATWVDGLGIPALDIELLTREDSEFDRNLRALLAVQRWLASQ